MSGNSGSELDPASERQPSFAVNTTNTTLQSQLLLNPAIDLSLEHEQRQRAAGQHEVMVLACVKAIAERFFGAVAQFANLELTDLVGQCL